MIDTPDLKQALQSLAGDVSEHVAYLRELGVSLLDAKSLSHDEAAIDGDDIHLSRADTRSKPEAIKPVPPSLRRNADEAARRAVLPAPPVMRDAPDSKVVMPDAPRDTSSIITSPSIIAAQSSPPASSHASNRIGNNDMPTKNNPGRTKVSQPIPQETLFGEITPADAKSLPRTDETLDDIRRDIGDCTRCPLYAGRTQVVHSEGNNRARLMFVGEAPGADEDASGHPFVGRAGQLLNKIIEAIGLKREDVYIGNVNRCRPPQNRTPTSDEAKTCKPFLMREIAIVQPDVVIVLGNTALHNLLDTKEGITKVRGTFRDYKGIKVMPTFHPAYLLRDPTKKREVWEDMKKVRDLYNSLKD